MNPTKILLTAALGLIMSAFSAQSAAIPVTAYVTFDISGTYPANYTNSQLTTPNSSFLIEFTVKQVVPADPVFLPFFFQTSLIDATYSFEGATYSATVNSSYGVDDSGGNIESITLIFETGTLGLSSIPFQHSPYLSTPLAPSSGEFLVGNLGPGTNWYVEYTPNGAPSVGNPVSVNEVVSRLVRSSPNDTVVTTVGPTITDSIGNTWAITSGKQVSLDGSTAATNYTSGVIEIAYVSGVVWQLNNSGNWYSFNANGSLGIGPTKTSPLH
jgi:hypothetical protein